MTLLVVPCFNEARRLDKDAFLEAVTRRSWLTLLFVDEYPDLFDRDKAATLEKLLQMGRITTDDAEQGGAR